MDSATAGSARSAFAHLDFRLYQGARLFMTLGVQMQSVAVGWHVYSLTQRPLDLGYVGLAQFLPAVVLSLVTGDTADRHDRRGVLLCCYVTMVVCALLLFGMAWVGTTETWPLYIVLVLIGTARAFAGPAGQSLVPHMVPAQHLSAAVAWNSTVFQVGTIAGPALGGLLYGAMHASGVYLTCAVLMAVAATMLALMEVRTGRMDRAATSWQRLLGGIRYVWRQKVVQLATPPEMRGRVSAVNMVFIGASNELGEFESGLTAEWLGVVPAVVLGGAGTCVVVLLWAWLFPDLRRIARADDVKPLSS